MGVGSTANIKNVSLSIGRERDRVDIHVKLRSAYCVPRSLRIFLSLARVHHHFYHLLGRRDEPAERASEPEDEQNKSAMLIDLFGMWQSIGPFISISLAFISLAGGLSTRASAQSNEIIGRFLICYLVPPGRRSSV